MSRNIFILFNFCIDSADVIHYFRKDLKLPRKSSFNQREMKVYNDEKEVDCIRNEYSTSLHGHVYNDWADHEPATSDRPYGVLTGDIVGSSILRPNRDSTSRLYGNFSENDFVTVLPASPSLVQSAKRFDTENVQRLLREATLDKTILGQILDKIPGLIDSNCMQGAIRITEAVLAKLVTKSDMKQDWHSLKLIARAKYYLGKMECDLDTCLLIFEEV